MGNKIEYSKYRNVLPDHRTFDTIGYATEPTTRASASPPLPSDTKRYDRPRKQ